MIGFASLAWCSVCILPSSAATGEVACVTVRTRAKSNPNPSIWYRVPCDYRKVPGRRWRTLVIFGGRNCGGGAFGDRAMPGAPFVGDDPDGTYWPAGSAEARSIPPEDRVPLPGRLVAEAWGKEGVVRRAETAPVGGRWRFSVDGVEVVCRAPAACRCVPARGSWRNGVGGRGGGGVHASGCRSRG